MVLKSSIQLITLSIIVGTSVLTAGAAIGSEIPTISTKVSLSDTVLDRSVPTPKTSLAQSAPSSFGNPPSKRNDVGIGFRIGDSSSFGIDGKFGISDKFSLRPSFYFGTKPGAENRAGGLPLTVTALDPFVTRQAAPFPATVTIPGSIVATAPITIGTTAYAVGQPIPTGTTIPAGTIIPAGFTFPTGTRIPQGFPVYAGLITSQNTGTAIGLAATYDMKLDEQGRSTAYIGPKLEFSSASGPLTLTGAPIPNTNVNINQTKIGLVAGADFEISDNFTIGANATFNFSNSLSGSVSLGNNVGSLAQFGQPTGSSLDFGIRAAYRF